ncbi:uncharacterized protein G2W53_034300 [Senna tora]|uniref:ATP-dependent DNA helicase n=1 Tax=Senna tora TaxID=362788 RepID=A0A834T020_9FABA|nr:uncharacterized protein G2W53_034300 [Senna tora]
MSSLSSWISKSCFLAKLSIEFILKSTELLLSTTSSFVYVWLCVRGLYENTISASSTLLVFFKFKCTFFGSAFDSSVDESLNDDENVNNNIALSSYQEKRRQRMKVLASRRVSNTNEHRRGRLAWSTLAIDDDDIHVDLQLQFPSVTNEEGRPFSALLNEECVSKSKKSIRPRFSMCCMQGKVVLPPVKRPPKLLDDLFSMKDPRSANFMKEIRNYNNMFAFTFMGGKIDHTVNNGKGPYVFRLHGQNMHLLGSLLPCPGERPKFSQLYIYDTDNEVSNRLHNASSSRSEYQFDATLIIQITQMLDSCNPLVMQFRTVKERCKSSNANNLRLRLIRKRHSDARTYNLPTAYEVAALIVGDFSLDRGERDIIVENRSGLLQRIDELHPLYLPMQYPLLFPYGEDGYREETLYRDGSISADRKQRTLTLRQYFAYKLQDRRNDFSMILRGKKLSQQFIVDAFTMVEAQRATFIRFHQKKLRSENYVTLTTAVSNGKSSSSSIGKRIILPSSFIGSQRYSRENYQDAMTICAATGFPDLFITFTCNPRWLELDRHFENLRSKPEDRPDMVARIFKIKLNMMMKDITRDGLFGKCRAVIYTIEFQKRGLPHAHILLWLASEDKFSTATQIDSVIFAEIPNQHAHPELHEAVKSFMLHGPCGASRLTSPCMQNGKCTKHFPKKFSDRTLFDEDGYAKYRRKDTGHTVVKNGVELDNRSVVPYNPTLLLRYQAHINVEFCNQSRSIKYLFKYVSKGHDKVTATICNQDFTEVNPCVDEIQQYYDCRYVSPCEAAWRIFGFDINYREPSVERLPFHLPNQQSVIFCDDDNLDDVVENATLKQSKFLAWFEANKIYPAARELTYAQFPTKFVFKVDKREWSIRKSGHSIGRLYYVAPGLGELHYLRVMLTRVKGPTSYEDIRTMNGVLHPTFKDACYALGLLDDDKEYIDGINEASRWSSGLYLRKLFSTLLIHNTISRPAFVWDQTWMHLSDDILIKERHRLGNPELQLVDARIKDIALAEIENILKTNGRSLQDFPPMPLPNAALLSNMENALLSEELNYDKQALLAQHSTLFRSLTQEQTEIYNLIMDSVNKQHGGGRTAHSRFSIPLECNENSTCNIMQGSELANLLLQTKLIIWDEAPMAHRFCFEALDKSLKDICGKDNPECYKKPFGGKVVVFGGDFRQILPVVPRGSRQDIVLSSLNSSYIWDSCKVLTLTKNMRLGTGANESENRAIADFANWILKIGDGDIGDMLNDEEKEINIPNDLLLNNVADPINSIVESTYPSFVDNYHSHDYIRDRAILAPTLNDVASINEYMLSLLPGEETTYLSSDSISNQEADSALADVYTTEFLNTISGSGLPYHMLKLKVGAPIMLLRNIDKSMGLCNGTRLIVARLCKHVIEATIISGKFVGERVVIAQLLPVTCDSYHALH